MVEQGSHPVASGADRVRVVGRRARVCVCVCVCVCVWLAVADVLDRRIISCGRPGESANTGNTRTLYRSVNAVQLS